MIALVDYGLGNIQAFANIYKRLNIKVMPVSTPEELEKADKIILPGVGSFDWAMRKLDQSGMREKLDEMVLERKTDVLGVCVGMQMMAEHSEEGSLPGLGWLKARVARFDTDTFRQRTHLPHMGWNDALPQQTKCLFQGIDDAQFYFLHSYYLEPSNPDDILSTTSYGASFVSAIRAGNVFGTQFHPEKSHAWGIQLLKNFAQL